MQQATSISLAIAREATETLDAQCDVLLDGKSTGILVSGHVLEAAIQVDESRYVVFTTADVPFEEFLTISLIDIHEGIKEVIRLGVMYGTGIFENLSLTKEAICFTFFADSAYKLKISRTPQWRWLPLFSEELCVVHRKISLKKYMTLKHTGKKFRLRPFFASIGIILFSLLTAWAVTHFSGR